MALDRAINGEVETIERDGVVIASRRRVCSDRLLIHLLKQRETRMERAAAEREAAHQKALVEARLAAFKARAAAPGKQVPVPPPLPELPDDATAEAEALTAFTAHARAFVDWPALAGVMPEPGPPVSLSPDNGQIILRTRCARINLPKPERAAEPVSHEALEEDPQLALAPPEPDAAAVEVPSALDEAWDRWQPQYNEWDGRDETRPAPVKFGHPAEVRIRTL